MGTVNNIPGIDIQLNGTSKIVAPKAINVVSSTGASVNVEEDPAGVAKITIPTGSAAYQPLDTDLTAIAALNPANDDIIQRKSSVWTNRTMAQLTEDLRLATNLVKGVMSTAAQTFAGLKDFTSGLKAPSIGLYDQGGVGNFLPPAAGFSANRSYTVPDQSGTVLLSTTVQAMGLSHVYTSGLASGTAARYYIPFLAAAAWSAMTPSSTQPEYKVPRAGTLFAFSANFGTNTIVDSFTVTVFVNGVATALTVTMTNGVTFQADTTHTVGVSAGDVIHFGTSALSGGGTFGAPMFTVMLR